MKKQVKLAIVVSSRYRKFSEVCLKRFVEYFTFEDKDIIITPHFFVHTHEKTCDINYDKSAFSQNSITQWDIDNINSILSPKKLKIEQDYKIIHEKLKDYIDNPWMGWCADPELNKDYSRFYQYHSFEEGLKMVWEYEKENNFEYDYVFKIRPDLFLKFNPLGDHISAIKSLIVSTLEWENIFKEIDPKKSPWSAHYRLSRTLYATEVRFICGQPKICDTVFFASGKGMKMFAENYFKDILDSTVYLYNKYKDDDIITRDCLLVPESVIVQHTMRKQMNIIQTPDALLSPVCIRSNWKIGGDFDDACRLYDEWWQGERKTLSRNA